MKTGHPIAVDRNRAKEPPGGRWAAIDPVGRGKVQVLPGGDNPISQAQVAVAELQRLLGLPSNWQWSTCAVVARDWSYLDPVRSLCELHDIPVEMANEDFSGFWHLRETRALRDWLHHNDSQLVRGADLVTWLRTQPQGPWVRLLEEAVAEYTLETGGTESARDSFVEWLAEWGREFRRRQDGLLLTTAHRAKGLEFDHVIVLDGAWDRVGRGEDRDAPRRLYYVAMTRARQTLTLMRFPGRHPFQDALHNSSSVLRRPAPVDTPAPTTGLYRSYRRLSLGDVFLSFAGYRPPDDPVHPAIAALVPGDRLQVRNRSSRWELLDSHGTVVGQLAQSFTPPANMRCAYASVLAIATWDRESSDPTYRERLRSDVWEVVVPELAFEPASTNAPI